MYPVLFEVGGFPIRTFGLMVALAIVLAAGIGYYMARGTKYQKHVIDMLFLAIVCALVGARVWHVFFFQWDYYQHHLGEIIAIWNGGIAIQGGLVGGFFGAGIYCWRHKLNFWDFADLMAPAIIFGMGIGRIGCFLTAGDFGKPTGEEFGIIYPQGTVAYETYGDQPLWPARLWEGQMDFIIFGILMMMANRRWPRGFMFLSYNVMYSVGRFFLAYLRGDSSPVLFGLKASQLTSIAVVIASIVVFLFLLAKPKYRTDEA
ncbi:MAG TPA: prolipoprotein diacylglyceryl transferase [Bacillales bacterium]|nr:prolipoprotein diacylglyceryl transferase [Bacillales bacterium]